MQKKKRLDPLVDIPEKKGDIDKHYVVAYTKLHGTPQQKKDIYDCIKANTKVQISNFTKEPYETVNMKAVREMFCGFFFKELNSGRKVTFEEELEDLLK